MYQMILFTGNEYLATGKKLLTKELILFLSLEKKSDVESDLCNQMRKVVSFYIAF